MHFQLQLSLTPDEKLELPNKLEYGGNLISLSVEDDVDESVIRRNESKRKEMRKYCFENKNKKQNCQSISENTKTQEALLLWFKQVRSQTLPSLVQSYENKTCQMAIHLGESANLTPPKQRI